MPLVAASREGNYDSVKFLLEGYDTEVNRRDAAGDTALIVAAEVCQSRIAQLLIEKGAEVNAANSRYGSTALTIAAGKCEDDPRVVRVLLDNGADVHARDSGGDTPLLVAAKKGNEKMVEMLLEAGAKVDEPNRGYTALMIAARRGYGGIVNLLIGKKADVNFQNEFGKTALSLARDYGQPQIVERLKKAGAR